MKRIPLVLIGVMVAAMTGLAINSSAFSPSLMTNQNGFALVQYDGGFDRESCEQNCRSLYGVDPYFRGGRYGDRGRYYVYAQCIQDCNTRFWKEFDRKMRDLEEE